MKKVIVSLIAVICCTVLLCSCFAESDYDPRSEGYYMIGSTDATALAFAEDFAESNVGLYQQFGIKTALYIFDTMEGADITDDLMDSVMSIHEAVVGDTSDDMVILIVLDKSDYRFWLGENVKAKCSDDALQEVLDAVKAEANGTIWEEIAKAYVGVSYRMLAWSMGNAAQSGN